MRLFYTNPEEPDVEQNDPDKSLGGYLSISGIPNDMSGNLFGSVSRYTVENELRETKGLILLNNTGSDHTGVTLHYDNNSTNPISTIEMAVVSLTQNEDGDYYMERIDSVRALPVEGSFSENEGVGSAIAIGDMDNGDMVGIWIKRTIDKDAINSLYECDNVYTRYTDDEELEKLEDIDIVINYT